MKKLCILLATTLLAIAVQAQGPSVIERIRQTNGALRSFDADLTNNNIKPHKQTEQTGKLYFVATDQFAAYFDNGKHMVVNADQLKINLGLFHGKFHIKKGDILRSLSNIFLYGFQGRCEDLANEENYDLKVNETLPFYQVVCNARKKSIFGIGYKTVIFNYEKSNFLLKEIDLIDNKGTIDSYIISNVKYDIPVDESVFSF